MSPNQDKTPATIRPTKKQRELLAFISSFITQHGYSPSYREIMTGLNYNSVATVALHVSNLIKRGHLRKRDHSARSLEVVNNDNKPAILSNEVTPAQEKWLIDQVEFAFRQVEQNSVKIPQEVDNLYVLVGALKILGLAGASQSFAPRLSLIKITSQSGHSL